MSYASGIHTLTIPSATRCLREVRKFVTQHARQAKLTEKHINALTLAVDEACANIIEHAYQQNPDHELTITMTIESKRVVVKIRDHGLPFNREGYQRPNVVELSRKRRSGGLGVDIMRRMMDKVEYKAHENMNEVRLIKFIRQSE
ncbi:MAG: ATP-binding protein [Rhodothermaceae bacterium]|nr:ATP-binding protein [Rhodothermaceae bacterium]MYF39787.1 ATP-binding protein [Rhodothermaceae bacterium]